MAYSERAVLWRSLVDGSLDRCALRQTKEGFEIEGEVHILAEGEPVQALYRVRCGPDWQTRDVFASWQEGPHVRETHITVTDDKRWLADGVEVPEVQGSVDIDLGITPATNTLPIRRLGLEVGESAEVTAAWMLFPELKLEPLPQRYTRVEPNVYLYESLKGSFKATIEVDDLGLAVEYSEGWVRIMSAGNL